MAAGRGRRRRSAECRRDARRVDLGDASRRDSPRRRFGSDGRAASLRHRRRARRVAGGRHARDRRAGPRRRVTGPDSTASRRRSARSSNGGADDRDVVPRRVADLGAPPTAGVARQGRQRNDATARGRDPWRCGSSGDRPLRPSVVRATEMGDRPAGLGDGRRALPRSNP